MQWLRKMLEGAAHVLDLGGTMAPKLEDIQTNDVAALRSDVEAIRRDTETVLAMMGRQEGGYFDEAE